MMYQCCIFLLTLGAFGHVLGRTEFPTLDHLKPSTADDTQAAAVMGLIKRKLGEKSNKFSVVIDTTIGPKHKDTFKLVTKGSGLEITGTSGVAAAWGFYYYMKTYCKGHVSWGGDQLNLPSPLPAIPSPGLTKTSMDRFRYYQNVCTVSYSFAWWNWARWEQEIDWMAMSGINLPLAFNAQEAIWQRVYLGMNFTQEELDKHFSGPAFFAWARMGNINGWGGPLPQSWHTYQITLQHKILMRMREFGMIPVLPAFAGHVPKSLPKVFPNAKVSFLGNWGGFPPDDCCTALLDLTDPLFTTIGKAFVEEYTKEFGTNHIYNCDTFNEMTPKSKDPSYISSAGKAVYRGMTAGDPDAIWLMQGWLFENSGFWGVDQAKALVTSVPQGKMIILDLFSELRPQYIRLHSYFGQPFIWCMLHDFGGTVQMYGALENINRGPMAGRQFPNSTMIGTGLTPEGINQNDVVYEFMNENIWRDKPRDINEWISDYAVRRYGSKNMNVDTAWKLLTKGVYNCTDGYTDHGTDTVVNKLPSSGITQNVWYTPEDLFQAWDNFLSAKDSLSSSHLYRYDLVDVTRQSLEVIAIKFYTDLMAGYNDKDYDKTFFAGTGLLNLLVGMDEVLGTDPHFLLGNWLEAAKALATNDDEKKLYEYNARNQITLWGPTGQIRDYANKQWSGLMREYYLKRWEMFVEALVKSVAEEKPFNSTTFKEDVFKMVEQPFTMDRSLFPTVTEGDSIEASTILHSVFRPATIKHKAFFDELPYLSKNHMKKHRHEHPSGISGSWH